MPPCADCTNPTLCTERCHYAYGSYRNAEFIAVREWLMSLRPKGEAGEMEAAKGDGK